MSDHVINGSTNVFADLGFSDAAERQAKTRLAIEINSIITARATTMSQDSWPCLPRQPQSL
jgi:hypothetical protein